MVYLKGGAFVSAEINRQSLWVWVSSFSLVIHGERKMGSSSKQWTTHDRVVATLRGEKPDRLPFIDRLELWYHNHTWNRTLPEEFMGMSLTEIHRAIGFGQEKFINAYSLRLRGVEVTSRFEGEVYYREGDPILDSFPHVVDLVQKNRAGVTTTEFLTRVGKVSVEHQTLPATLPALCRDFAPPRKESGQPHRR